MDAGARTFSVGYKGNEKVGGYSRCVAFKTRSATISNDRHHKFTRDLDNFDHILGPFGTNLNIINQTNAR
jgi:hypothetical protein